MEEITQGFSKYTFMQYVSRRVKHKVHYLHVLAIISLLLEEMTQDMIDGKTIKISNFGKFELAQNPDRMYFNVRKGEKMFAKGKKQIRIILQPRVKRKLFKYLDLDKMLKES